MPKTFDPAALTLSRRRLAALIVGAAAAPSLASAAAPAPLPGSDDPARALRDKLAVTRNPAHRTMLEVLIEHGRAEIAGDLDAIMKTLVASPHYHHYSKDMVGADAVRRHYGDTLAAGRKIPQPVWDRVLVDDVGIAADALLRIEGPGSLIRQYSPLATKPDAAYAIEMKIAGIVPFAGGLMIGEDTFQVPRSVKVFEI